jgi:rhodanese-related sulfurtransferase
MEGSIMPVLPKTNTAVTAVAAADPAAAQSHFETLLSLETDCWDVHAAITAGQPDFVLLDVRSPSLYEAGHIPGAISLPHARINERNLSEFPPEMLIVVYCNGPQCNGADRGAARLAAMGRRVKKMIGGIEGWKDEGFSLTSRNGDQT